MMIAMEEMATLKIFQDACDSKASRCSCSCGDGCVGHVNEEDMGRGHWRPDLQTAVAEWGASSLISDDNAEDGSFMSHKHACSVRYINAGEDASIPHRGAHYLECKHMPSF